MTNETLRALANINTNDDDFDAWADAQCAAYEDECDGRACAGDYNGPQSAVETRQHSDGRINFRDCTPEENAYYEELERRENDGAEEDEIDHMRAYSELRGYRR